MAPDDSDYDKRQYALMADRLQEYAAGRLSFGALIGDLRALLNILKLADDVWKAEFFNSWGTLETVYAISLDRKERGLPAEREITEKALVDEALANIRRLVSQRLETAY